jgi:hypothetical protein
MTEAKKQPSYKVSGHCLNCEKAMEHEIFDYKEVETVVERTENRIITNKSSSCQFKNKNLCDNCSKYYQLNIVEKTRKATKRERFELELFD